MNLSFKKGIAVWLCLSNFISMASAYGAVFQYKQYVPELLGSTGGSGATTSNISVSKTSMSLIGAYTRPISDTFTVYNNSDNVADIAVSSHSSDIRVSGCDQPVSARGNCTVTVSVDPKSNSTEYSGVITASASFGSASVNVAVNQYSQRVDVSSNLVNFGTIESIESSSVSKTITIFNNGSISQPIDQIVYAGSALYSISHNCPSSLVSGGSCQVIIQTNTPYLTEGSAKGIVTVKAQGVASQAIAVESVVVVGKITTMPASLDLGQVAVGSSAQGTLTVFNSGAGKLSDVQAAVVTTESLLNKLGSNYTINQNNCTTQSLIMAGSSCSIGFSFSPQSVGSYPVDLGFSTLSASGFNEKFTISTPAVDFGTVYQGQTVQDKSFAITNSSAADTSVSISYPQSDSLSVVHNCPSLLGANQTCYATVSINTQKTSTIDGYKIDIAGNSASSSAFVLVNGIVKSPILTVDKPSIDWGVVLNTAGSVAKTITVSNQTSVGIPASIVLSGSTQYTLDKNACNSTIAPNTTCDVAVKYTPDSSVSGDTSSAGTLIITDGLNQQTKIDLTAKSSYPQMVVDASGLSPAANIVVNATLNKTITITNKGLIGNLAITDVSAPAGISLDLSSCSTVIPGGSCNVPVLFAPTSLDSQTINGTISLKSVYETKTISVAGYTVSSAVLGLSGSASFGNIQNADSVSKHISVSNSGSADSTGLSIKLADEAHFSLANNTCGTTLVANQSCGLDIVANTSVNGSYATTLNVKSNSSTGISSIDVSAVVVDPGFSVDNPTLNWTSDTSSVSATQKSILVTNTGYGAIKITSISLGTVSGVGSYTVDNGTCGIGTVIAAGGTCAINVTPVNSSITAGGSSTAGLVITANGVSKSVTLTTLWKAPNILGFSDSHYFGAAVAQGHSATNYVAIYNNGTGSGSLTNFKVSLSSSDLASYSIVDTSSTCQSISTLAGNSNCYVVVKYAPAVGAPTSSSVDVIVTGSGGYSTVAFTLYGTSTVPMSHLSTSSLTIPDTVIGSSKQASLIVYNDGVGTLDVSGISLTPTSGSNTFSVSHNCPSSLAFGTSCSVSVTGLAVSEGVSTANLSITTSANASTVVVPVVQNGTKPVISLDSSTNAVVSTNTVAINPVNIGANSLDSVLVFKNTGSADATKIVTNFGSNPKITVVSDSCNNNALVKNATCSVVLRYTSGSATTTTGDSSTVLSVTPDTFSTLNTTVSGQSVYPAFSITSGSTAMGNFYVGQTKSTTFTVKNISSHPVTIAAGSLSVSAVPVGFSSMTVTSPCTSFAVGASCDITVNATANATVSGSVSAPIVATATFGSSYANKAGEPFLGQFVSSSVSSPVIGIASVSGSASLNGGTIDFGTRQVGSTFISTITLANNGNSSMTIGAPTGLTAPFTIANNNCATTVSVGSSCTMQIVYAPSTAATTSQSMTLVDSSGYSASYTISGVAKTGSATIVTTTNANPTISQGSKITTTYTVTNTGTLGLTVTSSPVLSETGSNAHSITANTCSTNLVLPVSGTCTISVEFNPTAVGTYVYNVNVVFDSGVGTLASSNSTSTSVASSVSLYDAGNVLLAAAPTITSTYIGSSYSTGVLTIKNNSAAALSNFSAKINNTNNASFSLTNNNCTSTLAANSSCSFKIQFAPTVAGSSAANLVVSADYTQGLSYSVTGTGLQDVVNSDTSSNINLGIGPDNAYHYERITLTNSGNTPVQMAATPYNLTAVGATPVNAIFTSGSCYGYNTAGNTLGAGSSCYIDVGFKDGAYTGANAYSMSLTALFTNSSLNKTFTVTTGQRSQLAVSNSITVSPVAGTTTGSAVVTITNNASTAFNFAGGTVGGASSNMFAISSTGSDTIAYASTTCGAAISAGGNCTATFTMSNPGYTSASTLVVTPSGYFTGQQVVNGVATSSVVYTTTNYSNYASTTISMTPTAADFSYLASSYVYGVYQVPNTTNYYGGMYNVYNVLPNALGPQWSNQKSYNFGYTYNNTGSTPISSTLTYWGDDCVANIALNGKNLSSPCTSTGTQSLTLVPGKNVIIVTVQNGWTPAGTWSYGNLAGYSLVLKNSSGTTLADSSNWKINSVAETVPFKGAYTSADPAFYVDNGSMDSCNKYKNVPATYANYASASVSGYYKISNGNTVYCDMTTDGGGWTLLGSVNQTALSGALSTVTISGAITSYSQVMVDGTGAYHLYDNNRSNSNFKFTGFSPAIHGLLFSNGSTSSWYFANGSAFTTWRGYGSSNNNPSVVSAGSGSYALPGSISSWDYSTNYSRLAANSSNVCNFGGGTFIDGLCSAKVKINVPTGYYLTGFNDLESLQGSAGDNTADYRTFSFYGR